MIKGMIHFICHFQSCTYSTRTIQSEHFHVKHILKELYFLFVFNNFYLANQRIPWDWYEPLKYVVALISQVIGAICTLYCVAPVISYMIGSCWLFCAFIKDITSELHVLRADRPSNGRQNERKKHLCKIIRLYSDVKELSDNTVRHHFSSRVRILRVRKLRTIESKRHLPFASCMAPLV